MGNGDNGFFDEFTAPKQISVVKEEKIYPNAPCPCGSGKKYKKCCGKIKVKEYRREQMEWKNLFALHILERGYDYFCENAVEDMEVSEDLIRASVIGTEEYEVEISLLDGEINDMYCSCPFAEAGRSCKHMAAVLYEWSSYKQDDIVEDTQKTSLFENAYTQEAYKKKRDAVSRLLADADRDILSSFLTDVLMENEKLLVRFYNIVNDEVTNEDVKHYKKQVDAIVRRHLGRDHFINYYEADGFISELEDLIDEDVRRMIDNAYYRFAFELVNYIFTTIGAVDMDDSNGGVGMLADRIYQRWLELLSKVNVQDKRKMFVWFTSHLDGSIIDYLEEYIEQIIVEEFKEKEYKQDKLLFVENMIEESNEKESGWSRSYDVGKWALRYLSLLGEEVESEQKRLDFCKKYWNNSSVRRYYIDICIGKKDYGHAIEVLDESILLDRDYKGLISEYSEKKKEIFLLQGNKSAYVDQLWKLVLEHEAGDLNLFKELKKQYTTEEWLVKREEVFKKLPKYAHVEQLYKEEKLYDRLLDFVIQSPGLYALQEFEGVLKKNYPEQLLSKYEKEVCSMAAYSSDRKKYKQLVSLLRRMQKLKGGSKIVEEICGQWRMKYRNRPAMMDELNKL